MSSLPAEHVALHTLCDHCQAIGLGRWTDSTWQYEVEDSAAAFSARSDRCHLCTLLLTQLDPDRWMSGTNYSDKVGVVRFSARPEVLHGRLWDAGKPIIQIEVSTDMFHDSVSTADFVMMSYGSKARVVTMYTRYS